VRRFLLHLKAERGARATTILEFAPAEAAQVDFGAGPVLTHESGVLLKTWFFVMTLCWSRHQYAEVVLDQTVETWLACHRRAFEWFGGRVERVIIDNAKCAITKACMYDPRGTALVRRAGRGVRFPDRRLPATRSCEEGRR
jgi:transposase